MKIDDKLKLLHDCLLLKISSLDGKTELFFKENYKQSPNQYKISLNGVRYLMANNFRQGNIVFDIQLCPIEQLNNEDFIELTGSLDYRKSVVKQKVFLLHSSYGCKLISTYQKLFFTII